MIFVSLGMKCLIIADDYVIFIHYVVNSYNFRQLVLWKYELKHIQGKITLQTWDPFC